MKETLSIKEAQKIILHSQKLPSLGQKGSSLSITEKAIEHLGYIQIDTISAIQRAHNHTLWNRNPNYALEDLDTLVSHGKVFEYWAHAASYLPMTDFRFTLPRKQALASGEQNHWYKRDPELMQYVLDRITAEGPLMAKDFEHKGPKRPGEWYAKPAKQALEHLFMQGDLMISRRENFHKVYDLTERVLPEGIDLSVPTPDEVIRFLINSFLRANGLGQANEIAYLRKNTKKQISTMLQEMEASREIVSLSIKGGTYYALPSALELLNKPLSRSKAKILSPFDNLVIQRKRMEFFFDYSYLIECYLPEKKRQYGYFSLPILWNGDLVARVDCKAERKSKILYIKNLVLEESLKKVTSFIDALSKELIPFMVFNECQSISVIKTSPEMCKELLEEKLYHLL